MTSGDEKCAATGPAGLGSDHDKIWVDAYDRLVPHIQLHGCRAFHDGFDRLALPDDRVPTAAELDEVVGSASGWRVVWSDDVDRVHRYRHFLRREFPVRTRIRSRDEIPMPFEADLLTDVIGTLPYFVDPVYARLQERIAGAFVRASGPARRGLTRLLDASMERGLTREHAELKAFGSSLVAADASMQCVVSGDVAVRPFRVEAVLEETEEPVLFVVESLEQIQEELGRFVSIA